MNNRGQLAGLPFAVMTLVVAVIVLVLGLVIVQEMRDVDTLTSDVIGCNATSKAGCYAYEGANVSLAGLGDMSDFIPIIVIAIAAGVVVAIVLGSFAFRSRTR